MAAVGDDFKVSRRYREQVKDLAAEWRAANPIWADQNWFNVVELLVDHVLPSLAKAGRVFTLKIVEDDLESPHAWVDFGTHELSVQEFIWARAKQHENHARLVLAHEIGHMILHKDQVFAFSRGLEKKLGSVAGNESAEQQANWFAAALLVSDRVLRRLSKLDDSSIATLTLVSEQVVRVRRREVEMDKRYRQYTGDQCPQCNGWSLIQVGIDTVCDECGIKLGSA